LPSPRSSAPLGFAERRSFVDVIRRGNVNPFDAFSRAHPVRALVLVLALLAAARPAQAQQSAGAYMNVSFVGLLDAGWSTEPDVQSLQVGDHDPKVRG